MRPAEDDSMVKIILAGVLALMLTACGTSDGALREQGHSAGYVQGFHDGRHSGMSEEGNAFEHYIRDSSRFETDADYREGWLAGELEGKRLEEQATAVGSAVGSGYTGYRVGEEAHKATDADAIARDAIKHSDTSQIKNLEK